MRCCDFDEIAAGANHKSQSNIFDSNRFELLAIYFENLSEAEQVAIDADVADEKDARLAAANEVDALLCQRRLQAAKSSAHRFQFSHRFSGRGCNAKKAENSARKSATTDAILPLKCDTEHGVVKSEGGVARTDFDSKAAHMRAATEAKRDAERAKRAERAERAAAEADRIAMLAEQVAMLEARDAKVARLRAADESHRAALESSVAWAASLTGATVQGGDVAKQQADQIHENAKLVYQRVEADAKDAFDRAEKSKQRAAIARTAAQYLAEAVNRAAQHEQRVAAARNAAAKLAVVPPPPAVVISSESQSAAVNTGSVVDHDAKRKFEVQPLAASCIHAARAGACVILLQMQRHCTESCVCVCAQRACSARHQDAKPDTIQAHHDRRSLWCADQSVRGTGRIAVGQRVRGVQVKQVGRAQGPIRACGPRACGQARELQTLTRSVEHQRSAVRAVRHCRRARPTMR